MDSWIGEKAPAAFRRVPGAGNETSGEEQDPQTEGDREGPVPHEACHDVTGEPVALQGRDERLDARRLIRGKRGVGHGQKGNGSDKGPEDPAAHAPFHDEVQKHDRPGKKDQSTRRSWQAAHDRSRGGRTPTTGHPCRRFGEQEPKRAVPVASFPQYSSSLSRRMR